MRPLLRRLAPQPSSRRVRDSQQRRASRDDARHDAARHRAGVQRCSQPRARSERDFDVRELTPATLHQVLRRDPRVTQLGDLVRTSGIDLTPLRNPETKFSVFAPNNTVFERLRQKNNVSVAQARPARRPPGFSG